MRNFVRTAETLTLTAPYAVASGGGMLVGAIFAVALAAAAGGATVEVKPRGEFDLAKATAQAWTQGVKLYWDNAAKVLTTTSAGNTLVGAATQTQASADAIGRAWIIGIVV